MCTALSQYSTLRIRKWRDAGMPVSAGSSWDNVQAAALRRTLTSHGCLFYDVLLERFVS